jgi:hypothetical protein
MLVSELEHSPQLQFVDFLEPEQEPEQELTQKVFLIMKELLVLDLDLVLVLEPSKIDIVKFILELF